MWLAGVALVTVVLLPACGLDHKAGAPEDDSSDFSADQLDMQDDVLLDDLDPAEQSAVERSGMSVARSPDDPQEDTKSDKAGRVGLSVLSVAMTIGAAVAPFFLL